MLIGPVYDASNPVAEYNPVNGNQVFMLTGLGADERYVRGTDYFLTDALGSTIALTDSGGNLTTQYTYDAFGGSTTSGPATTNRYAFTGREFGIFGLYYMRGRYYLPNWGRYLTPDKPDGTNQFAFAGNNPAGFVDPMGHEEVPPPDGPPHRLLPTRA